MAALVHPQVEIGGPRGTARGVKTLREWFGRANIQLIPERWFVQGNQVVVTQSAGWHAPDSGEITSRQAVATLFCVNDAGLITRIVRHESLPAALEDACMAMEDEVNV